MNSNARHGSIDAPSAHVGGDSSGVSVAVFPLTESIAISPAFSFISQSACVVPGITDGVTSGMNVPSRKKAFSFESVGTG